MLLSSISFVFLRMLVIVARVILIDERCLSDGACLVIAPSSMKRLKFVYRLGISFVNWVSIRVVARNPNPDEPNFVLAAVFVAKEE